MTLKTPIAALTGVALVATLLIAGSATAQGRRRAAASTQSPAMTVVLGRPTDRSLAISVLSPSTVEAFAEYGIAEGKYAQKSLTARGEAGQPFEIELASLEPNTRYFYRLRHRAPGAADFITGSVQSFMTARAAGSTFTFGVQGDSHPEREGRMFDPELYRRTLDLVARARPDFYFMLGDDFSIERLIAQKSLSQSAVDSVYAGQRPYLSRIAGSTPLFLVNGNHEEAARFLLDGTATNAAVFAGRARTRLFPLPAPDHFYTGNAQPEEHIGLLRDYYAWTWGDALFVVIDPYWHSSTLVDAPPGGGGGGDARSQGERGPGPRGGGRQGGGGRGQGGNAAQAAGRNRDLWSVTLGDAQYAWLKQTLLSSKAKYKFVFAHHVMGTGRGAIEGADFYEWGGQDPRGRTTFKEKRPTWDLPIHQLMAKAGVTIFFQGHDHLFARQQKDGIVYQEVPNPADATYTAFNREAYRSGDILPNAGHLLVTVAPDGVTVDYVRSYLTADESPERKHGDVAFSYRIPPFTRP